MKAGAFTFQIEMKKKLFLITLLASFLAPLFVGATVNLDPNDPNFPGYPDGNSPFNAQCTSADNYFWIYFDKLAGPPFGNRIQCQGDQFFYNWQAYYDYIYGMGGVSFLLETAPAIDCAGLTFTQCVNAGAMTGGDIVDVESFTGLAFCFVLLVALICLALRGFLSLFKWLR